MSSSHTALEVAFPRPELNRTQSYAFGTALQTPVIVDSSHEPWVFTSLAPP